MQHIKSQSSLPQNTTTLEKLIPFGNRLCRTWVIPPTRCGQSSLRRSLPPVPKGKQGVHPSRSCFRAGGVDSVFQIGRVMARPDPVPHRLPSRQSSHRPLRAGARMASRMSAACPSSPEPLPWAGGIPMDFSCAAVGTGGEFSEDGLTFTLLYPAGRRWSPTSSAIGNHDRQEHCHHSPCGCFPSHAFSVRSPWPTSNRSSALPTSTPAKIQLTCAMFDSSPSLKRGLAVLPCPACIWTVLVFVSPHSACCHSVRDAGRLCEPVGVAACSTSRVAR